VARTGDLTTYGPRSAVFRRLAAHAEEIGFKFVPGVWGVWNDGAGCHEVNDLYELAHEMGHFFVAPKARRHLKYFGLGSPTYGTGRLINPNAANREEDRAAFLGYAYMAWAGMPMKDLIVSVRNTGVDEGDLIKALAWAQEDDRVNAEGSPFGTWKPLYQVLAAMALGSAT
jgi:hypothetical protein